MLAVRNPLVDIAREILKDSRSRFTVLVLRLEMSTLLGQSCEGRGHSLLTGPISGDNAEATIPLAVALRPYPPTKTCCGSLPDAITRNAACPRLICAVPPHCVFEVHRWF
jgi:hypothetical protein